MATRVRMKNPTTGLTTDGFIGFSWTSLFFGEFPALIRGDVVAGIVLLLLGLVAAALSAGLLWFVVGIVWAFIYNKKYTVALLEKGYLFADDEAKVAGAKAALGISN